MKKMMTLLVVLGLVLALAPAVQATDITVANHSFETHVLNDGAWLEITSATIVSGWTPVNNTQSSLGLWNPQDGSFNGTTGSTIPAPGDGHNLINAQSPLHLWKLYQQPDSHVILANQVYTLTTAVGERKDYDLDFSTMTISLKAGSHNGTTLATRDLVRQNLLDVEGYTRGNLYDFAISFNSADYPDHVGQALYIVYEAYTKISGQVNFDNVRLSYSAAGTDPTVTLSSGTVSENNPKGTVVGTLGMSNADDWTTPVYTFNGGTDDGSFTIDGTSLKTAEIFDYETKNSYSIDILATDSADPANSTNGPFTISIIDVPEPNSLFARGEVASGQTLVGTLEAIDATGVTYGVNAAKHHGVLFQIGGAGDELHLKTPPEEGAVGDEYFVEVTATGTLTDSMLVEVTVVSGAPKGTLFIFR